MLAKLQLAQLRPARVDGLLVTMLFLAERVEVGAADAAETATVLSAQNPRREREREHERVTCPAGQLERSPVHVRAVELLPITRLVHLACVDRDHRPRLGHAAHTRAFERRVEPQVEGVPGHRFRNVETRFNRGGPHAVGLTGQLEGLDTNARIDRPRFASAKIQGPEVQCVGALRHV